VWLRLRGGKGVAVATGVFSVLAPFATLVAACVFGAVAATTRIVSLASIAATLTLPSIAWLSGSPPPVLGAAAGVGALILFRHRSNVRRMFARREYRLGEQVR
jgi:glycerol-3-phosphate acyltransferase PlsY